MGHAYLCRKIGKAGEERRSCVSTWVLTSIHLHPSIHQSLGHPLCVHLTRNLQGADKEDHLSIEDKGQPVEGVKKNQLLLLILFFVFLQTHPLPSLTPAGFLAICTNFPMGAGSAHAGMWEDEEEARLHRGLPCFSAV